MGRRGGREARRREESAARHVMASAADGAEEDQGEVEGESAPTEDQKRQGTRRVGGKGGSRVVNGSCFQK